MHGHPLTGVKRELLRTGQCREILLGGLPAEDVARYLALRFPGAALPAKLLPLLVERSDGSPFVVVALVDHLLEHGMLVRGERAGSFTATSTWCGPPPPTGSVPSSSRDSSV